MSTVIKITYEPTRKITETKYSHSSHSKSKNSIQPIQKLNSQSKSTLKKIIKLTRVDTNKCSKQSQVTVNYHHKIKISVDKWNSLIENYKSIGLRSLPTDNRLDLKWFTIKSKIDKLSIVVNEIKSDVVFCDVFYYQGRITVE